MVEPYALFVSINLANHGRRTLSKIFDPTKTTFDTPLFLIESANCRTPSPYCASIFQLFKINNARIETSMRNFEKHKRKEVSILHEIKYSHTCWMSAITAKNISRFVGKFFVKTTKLFIIHTKSIKVYALS